jgi:hypothetical protein
MPRLNGYAAKISLDVIEKAIQLYGLNYPKRPKCRRRRIYERSLRHQFWIAQKVLQKQAFFEPPENDGGALRCSTLTQPLRPCAARTSGAKQQFDAASAGERGERVLIFARQRRVFLRKATEAFQALRDLSTDRLKKRSYPEILALTFDE